MKKTITTLALAFVAFAGLAQELSAESKFIKSNYVEGYDIIKVASLQEWGTNYNMVVYQINNETKALYGIINAFESDNTQTLYECMIKWSYEGKEAHTKAMFKNMKTFDLESALKFHVNWNMVLYNYNLQVKAKGAF